MCLKFDSHGFWLIPANPRQQRNFSRKRNNDKAGRCNGNDYHNDDEIHIVVDIIVDLMAIFVRLDGSYTLPVPSRF